MPEHRTLQATLPVGTVYVTGTVNGVITTWTNTNGNVWETIAARSVNDVYTVTLDIIDSLGVTTRQSFVVYLGMPPLITDRTQADVNRVKVLAAKGWLEMTAEEKAEWLSGMKGAYNAADLNRVGAAVAWLKAALEGLGYHVNAQPRQGWTVSDIPTAREMAVYLGGVQAIRALWDAAMPPLPSSMDHINYTDANEIERLLVTVEALIGRLRESWMYTGDVFAGEV